MEYPHDRGAGQMFEPGKTDIGRQGVLIMRQASIIAIAAAVSAGAATAQYTTVRAPRSGEASHSQILSSALGGSFTSATSKDYSNGTIYADRMKDSTYNSVGSDRYWAAGTYHAKMVAKEAAYSHTFGTVAGTYGGGNLSGYQALLNSSPVGTEATVTMDQDFRWALDVDRGGNHSDILYTSRDWDNAGSTDHMVSYKLLRDGNLFGYALFFEDIKYCSDKDYNDVAVILTLVPTPQAAMMGLTGLGGLGLLAGRRRRESM